MKQISISKLMEIVAGDVRCSTTTELYHTLKDCRCKELEQTVKEQCTTIRNQEEDVIRLRKALENIGRCSSQIRSWKIANVALQGEEER